MEFPATSSKCRLEYHPTARDYVEEAGQSTRWGTSSLGSRFIRPGHQPDYLQWLREPAFVLY